MIECPWCAESVELSNGICPSCMHEVLPEHLEPFDETKGDRSHAQAHAEIISDMMDMNIEHMIEQAYRCRRCGHDECRVKEVAMTGTGFSKLIDLQYNHYLFVSCLRCASVDIYDPDVLRGRTSGTVSNVLDLLFGG